MLVLTSATHDIISRHCRVNAVKHSKVSTVLQIRTVAQWPIRTSMSPCVWAQLVGQPAISFLSPPLCLCSISSTSQHMEEPFDKCQMIHSWSQDIQEPCVLDYSCPSGKGRPTDCWKLQTYTYSFIERSDHRIRQSHPQDSRDPWK